MIPYYINLAIMAVCAAVTYTFISRHLRRANSVWNTPIYMLTTRQLEELRLRCTQDEYNYILFLYSAIKARPALTVKEALQRFESIN